MTDDFDIEALIEAPFKKKDDLKPYYPEKDDYSKREGGPSSPSGRRSHRSRSPSGNRHHSYDHERRRSRSPHKKSYHHGHGDRNGGHRRDFGRSKSPSSIIGRYESTPILAKKEEPSKSSPSRISAKLLTESQRDRRTVFCRQLAQRLEPRDLKEFCEQAGPVRDVKVVYDRISRRSKGVAYVEFVDEDSVATAIALTGKKLSGIPIIIELTETEKNRIAEEAATALKLEKQSLLAMAVQLQVENIHPSVTENDFRKVFQPFGDIIRLQFVRFDSNKSSAILQFRDNNDAHQAMEKLNGFNLAGRPITILLKEPQPKNVDNHSSNQQREVDSFFDDLEADSLLRSSKDTSALKILASNRPSPCILLQYMYDPQSEMAPDWDREIGEEVRDECTKFGRVEHVHVPRTTDGDVFVRFGSVDSAHAAVNALSGRWFGGKQISAAFIPLNDYLQRYPEQ